ncbi:MAG: FAD-binding protein, partial [Deltaproteobacteria bacterium]|nr:FAD-binding protein [Deltaproteobacteria bacterium]
IEKFLYFEGDGVCFTIDMAFTQPALEFMRSLDDLTMEVGAIPNIIKDSRLPRAVVSACYPQYEITRDRLARHDPDRLFRSELSERLGL